VRFITVDNAKRTIMTLTAPSEIAQRHLPLFDNKHLLLAGELEDDFVQQLSQRAASVNVFTTHHGFATRQKKASITVHAGATLDIDHPIDLVLFYWPKAKAEADYLLAMLTHALGEEVDWMVVGENRSGIKSIEKRFAPYGSISKYDAARRCSMYYGTCHTPASSFSLEAWFTDYPLTLGETSLTIRALPGVFSQKSLDDGTELLLRHLPSIKGNVLDVGCGAGVIGSYILATYPDCQVTLVDVNYLAIASSKATLAANGLDGQVLPSDMLDGVEATFNTIISNPPFHDGLDTRYSPTESLLRNVPSHLSKGGQLIVVANSFLRYPPIIKDSLGQCESIAKTRRFAVYHAYKTRE
jgi:16S rRNA (guanine1207-N2)-methyltransferase